MEEIVPLTLPLTPPAMVPELVLGDGSPFNSEFRRLAFEDFDCNLDRVEYASLPLDDLRFGD